jgi:choline-sulfatase
MKKRPNILFIMADQFNAGCISALGSQVRTPHLDRLVKEGLVFDRAYCNSPICGPSRCSIATSQYPHTHGILGNAIHGMDDRNPDTLGAVLRRGGYQTAVVGKSHMIRNWDSEAYEHIRYCDMADCDPHDPLDNHYFRYLHEQGMAHLYDLGTLPDSHPGSRMRAFNSAIPDRHSLETWTGDTALAFLEQRDKHRPFFLHLSFQRPHEPLTVPHDRGLLYSPEEIELPANAEDWFSTKFAGKPSSMHEHARQTGGYPYIPEDKQDLRRQLAYYYSLITIIDEQIGRMLQRLDQSGDGQETIVVFTADHGDFAGEHGMMLKNMGIYEAVHRVPLIMKAPNVSPNRRTGAFVESIDIYPTLCELVNVAVPDSIEGRNLVGVLNGEEIHRKHVIAEWDFEPRYANRVNAIRTPQYRFVYYGKDQDGELYDLERDPGELYNVYAEESYRIVRMSLMEELFDHINRYKVKASFATDKAERRLGRNTFTALISKGGRNWDEVSPLYRK